MKAWKTLRSVPRPLLTLRRHDHTVCFNRSADGGGGILQVRESVQLPASQERVLPPIQGMKNTAETGTPLPFFIFVPSAVMKSLILQNESHFPQFSQYCCSFIVRDILLLH